MRDEAMTDRTPGAMQVCEKCGERWDDTFDGCIYQAAIPNKEWARKYCPIEIAIAAEEDEITGASEIEYSHSVHSANSLEHWKRP